MTTRTLKSNVSREQALRQLTGGVVRTLAFGPLRAVADVYLPFRLYAAQIRNGHKSETRFVGIDAVSGDLDIYTFAGIPGAEETQAIEARNRLPILFSEEASHSRLLQKLQRVIYTQHGFFRLKGLSITATSIPTLLHVPYWIGFYGRADQLQLAILNAVSGGREGAKLRHIVRGWLTSDGSWARTP
jgi:hypothetical protein